MIGGVLIINLFFCGVNVYNAWTDPKMTHTYKYVYPCMQVPALLALIPFFAYWYKDTIQGRKRLKTACLGVIIS